MNNTNASSNSWAANNKSNTIRLAFWTFTWVASMAVAAFGPRLLWDYATVPTVIGILVNLAFGFGMIMANRRYLRGLDELHRKIFLDASALTLGVGLVCGLAYEQLKDVRLITFEPEISHLVILMSITFMVSMIAGNRKYQ